MRILSLVVARSQEKIEYTVKCMKTDTRVKTASAIILLLLSLAIPESYAQLSGVKTIPGNYASVAAAISDLNSQGVGAGGVTFNVAAGYLETLSARLNLTATGTSGNPITFQKSGSGVNPRITAFNGNATPSSATPDGIWSFQGADYVTIDGIDLYDPNSTNPATMEYGFGLFRNTAYDGAQNNTIRNCTITLNRVNNASGTSPMVDGSVCILVINSTPTAATTAFAPFAPAGTNSFNKFYSNLLQNCNYGIVMTGSIAATPFDLGDNGNDVGGSSLSTGNTILNYGGGTSNTTATAGVRAINQWGLNISYNTINNNNGSGANPNGDLYGINAESGLSASVNINDNIVTVKATTGASDVYAITNGIGATAASNTVNINNNIIMNCTARDYFDGIYNSADAATVNINYNTVSYVTASSTSGGMSGITSSVFSGSQLNLNIGNNLVSHLTKTGISGGSLHTQDIYGISCASLNSYCHDNTIEYLTVTGSANSGSITGINGNYGGTCSETYTNNIIREAAIGTNILGSNFKGIGTGNTGTKVVQNNQVYDVALNNTQSYFYGINGKGQISDNIIHDVQVNTASTILVNMIGIFLIGDGNVSHNQVYGISLTGGSTGTITGISATYDHTATICKNTITNLSAANTAAIVDGIDAGSNTKNVYNNFISDLRAPNSASTTAMAGINVQGSGTYGIYYNSIYMNANSTGATFGTSAIFVNTAGTVDLRNNNFVNTSIPNGGGYTCAYRRSSTTLTSYSSLSNNNNFYAGTPGLYRLIYYDGTNSDQTLAAYKMRVAPRDAVSVNENPPFINTTTIPFDLHLSTSTPTQCESQGIHVTSPVAITDDYDGDIRWGESGYSGTGAAPDIGADEGNFTILDLNAPVITYTPLGNSCTTADRTLSAAITDLSGVPLSGLNVPRVYYRKNSGSWYSQPGAFNSGTATSSIWSFTIVASDMGGVITGDIVSYFIIAQDIWTPPNVGSNPVAGLVATSVNSVTTPPTTPTTYTILNFLTGTIQVGVGRTFTTLTAAAVAYNSSSYCLNGNVVFELTDAGYTTSETFPIEFNLNPFASPTNTLTIRPANGITTMITGSSSSALIKFNGAKYITINGSNSGGTDRNLYFTNSSTSGTIAVIWVGSTGTGNGATNITIKNCNLSCGSNSATSYGIYAGSSATLGTAGDDNDNLTIQNNNIYKVYYGIAAVASSTGLNDNLVITQNLVGAPTSDNYITFNGIKISQATGAVISGNTVFNIMISSGNPTGISIGTGVVSSSIDKNSLNNIRFTGPSTGNGGRGIYVNTGNTASNLNITNNIIYQISGIGSNFPSLSTAGIMTDGASGGINIWFNSVYLSGTNSPNSVVQTCAMMVNSTVSNGLDIRDNIFQNSQVNATSSQAYAIYSSSAATVFANINYNDYYVTGTQGVLGYLGTNKTTLAQWQSATGNDANSQNVDPLFVALNDLRPGLGSTVSGGGVSISGMTTDFLGVTRNSPPTMGAYENDVDVLGPAISYTPLGNTESSLGRILTATITDASGIPLSGIGLPVLYWKINAGSWIPVTGVSLGGNQYQFSFGTGVMGGDMVYYFVAAQDLNNPTPNVSCNPSAGAGSFTYNPPNATTPPTTPNSYRIIIPLIGDLVIGTGGDYPNLTGNTGLFKAINDNVLAGNVTALIASDLTEDGTNALNQWTEEGGSNYTLTIQPFDKNDRLISGSAGNSNNLICLNGADRVHITGMYSGSGPFLTFRNTSATYGLFRIQNDANYDTLEYCFMESGNNSGTGVIGITSTTGNHDIVITNNTIRDRSDATGIPFYGIYASGSSTSNYNITISGNQVFNFSFSGLYLNNPGNGNNWTITNNSFYNTLTPPPSGLQFGIMIDAGSSSNGNLISGNFIGGQAPNCGGSPWVNLGANSFYGIYVNGGTAAGTSIQGNTIQNITKTSTGNNSFYGIYSYAGNNSIGTLAGNIIGSQSAPASIVVAGTGNVYGIYSITSNSTIKHNVISNINQTAANPGIFYGIYLSGNYAFTIEANSILNCGATSSSTGIKDVTGIYFAGAASGTQPCNLINNLISLGHGYTNNNVYKGIDDFGYSGNNLFSYFNSIYIGGTGNGISNSYGYLKRDVPNETHKNNIYYNNRMGGTGYHYSIANTKITSGTFTSDYNDLFTTGPVLAVWNTTNQADISAWRTASGQDANSKSINPGFLSTTDLHPTASDFDGAGIAVTGITTDYAGILRGNPPDIGAYEFTPGPKTWNGSLSVDWNNPLNWTPNGVPSPAINVTIPSGTPHLCIINFSGMACKDMILDGTTFIINTSMVMTIYGNLTIQNNASMTNNGALIVNGQIIIN